MKRLQTLDQHWVERCLDFGKKLVAWYASPQGSMSASRSRSGLRGTEANHHRLAQGKAGEVAFALLLGLDPEQAILWTANTGGDGGYDIVLPNGCRVDVKTTYRGYKLGWSKDVNDLYWEKKFDVIASVSLERDDYSICWIDGYITKDDFFRRKLISNGTNSRQEIGTWFVEKDWLTDIKVLASQAGLIINEDVPKPRDFDFERLNGRLIYAGKTVDELTKDELVLCALHFRDAHVRSVLHQAELLRAIARFEENK